MNYFFSSMGVWKRGGVAIAGLRVDDTSAGEKIHLDTETHNILIIYGQMFWVSWGQVWCAKYRDAALKKQGWFYM